MIVENLSKLIHENDYILDSAVPTLANVGRLLITSISNQDDALPVPILNDTFRQVGHHDPFSGVPNILELYLVGDVEIRDSPYNTFDLVFTVSLPRFGRLWQFVVEQEPTHVFAAKELHRDPRAVQVLFRSEFKARNRASISVQASVR